MPNQTIYEQMSRERMKIAVVQIDIISHYNSEGREKRVQELYEVSHQSMIDEPSEHSLEKMDKLIRKYQEEIRLFREKNPNTEKNRTVRKKMKELERLCSSCGF